MSTTVFDAGSTYDFKPERFKATYTPDGCDPIEHQCFGWATQVVSRDGWTVVTRVVAMVQGEAGALRPLSQVTNAPGRFRLGSAELTRGGKGEGV